jgi:hypothetical protein
VLFGVEHAKQTAPALPHKKLFCCVVPAERHVVPLKTQPLVHAGGPPPPAPPPVAEPPPEPETHRLALHVWAPAHCTHAPLVVEKLPHALFEVPP